MKVSKQNQWQRVLFLPKIVHQIRKIYVNDKPVYEKFIGSNTNSPIKSAVFYRIFFLFKQRLRYDKLNARA